MAFIETRFLDNFIALGSSSGPEYLTDVTELSSGLETRGQAWSYPRHRYAVRIAAGTASKIEALRQLHHSTKGRFNGFRFKDFNDFNSAANIETEISYSDQALGVGDGTNGQTFQLIKTYSSGTETQVRNITKPVSGTLLVGYSEASATPSWYAEDTSGRYSLDTTSGILSPSNNVGYTFTGASSDGVTTLITAGYYPFTTGMSVSFSTFTGDWAGLNGLRYTITRVSWPGQFRINHDSSTYAAYSGNAGRGDTVPQSWEYLTVGYEFDVPVRFNQDQILIDQISPNIEQSNIELIEIK